MCGDTVRRGGGGVALLLHPSPPRRRVQVVLGSQKDMLIEASRRRLHLDRQVVVDSAARSDRLPAMTIAQV